MKMYIPTTLQVMGIAFVSLVVLNFVGLLRFPLRALGIFFLMTSVLLGVFLFFLHNFRYLNCFLMRNHKIIQQPWSYENLTQRFTEEATRFIER